MKVWVNLLTVTDVDDSTQTKKYFLSLADIVFTGEVVNLTPLVHVFKDEKEDEDEFIVYKLQEGVYTKVSPDELFDLILETSTTYNAVYKWVNLKTYA